MKFELILWAMTILICLMMLLMMGLMLHLHYKCYCGGMVYVMKMRACFDIIVGDVSGTLGVSK